MELFDYTTQNVSALEHNLRTSSKNGLTEQQVREYHSKYGFNEIPDTTPAWWYFLVAQFKSPFLLILIGAALFSFFLEGQSTGVMIMLIIILNAAVGFYQEYRADRSVRLLKNMIPQLVIVTREGKDHQIPARELVPGDILTIETGSIIPADVRFIGADKLSVDESMITGESVAVVKTGDPLPEQAQEIHQATNIGYAGTLVTSGRGHAIVLKTGAHSLQGVLGTTVSTIAADSIFAQEISHFTNVLLKGIALIFILFMLLHVVWGKTDVDIFQTILFVIALAISVTPEGLPIVIMFTLSRSARRLAREKVIVKRLAAVNDLGSIQVLCVDKTGTLTQNSMKVAAWKAEDEEKLLLYAALSCERPHIEQRGSHSLDDALWDMVSEELRQYSARYSVVKVVPFDPATRTNEVIMAYEGGQVHIIRGACEAIVERCGLAKEHDFCDWVVEQGQLGRRVIAVAAHEEGRWYFVGLVSFVDPLKPSVQGALEQARLLKVQVKLITGDAPEVAGVIAQEAGIIHTKKEVVLGKDLVNFSPQELEEVVVRCHVFARVAPDQKYLIVRTLQQKYAVGFLGDGINDVLAIKAAHVGIVVQGCTDVAREAADIILLHKSLASIVHGIRAGREAVANTKKYITGTLASNVGNFCALAVSSLFVSFLPLLPIQILLLNLLSDIPMLAFSGDAVDIQEIDKPARFDIPWMVVMVLVFGFTSSLFDFLMFYIFSGHSAAYLQTYWFIGCVFTELVFIFTIRTRYSILSASRPGLLLMFLTVMSSVTALLVPMTAWGRDYFYFIRPEWYGIRALILIAIIFLGVMECVKQILYRYKGRIQQMLRIF